MLPYSPMHHLLFDYLDEDFLVMTSANPSGVPMYIAPESVLSSLAGIADYFLLHNRKIQQLLVYFNAYIGTYNSAEGTAVTIFFIFKNTKMIT